MEKKSHKQIPSKVGYFLYFAIGKNKMQENCARDKVGKAKQMKPGQSKHIEMLNVIIFPCLLYNVQWRAGLRFFFLG